MGMSSELANTVQAVCSVVNLIIVVLFFVFERFSHSQSIKKEKESYWYHETIIKQGLPAIDSCFIELEKLLSRTELLCQEKSPQNELALKQIIFEVQKLQNELKKPFSPYAKLFNENLYNKLRRIIEKDIVDFAITEIEKCYNTSFFSVRLGNTLNKQKFELLKELYDFERNITISSLKYSVSNFRNNIKKK